MSQSHAELVSAYMRFRNKFGMAKIQQNILDVILVYRHTQNLKPENLKHFYLHTKSETL